MSASPTRENPHWYLHSLHEYVAEPLETALTALDREHGELTAESEALETFRDIVVDVDTEGPQGRAPAALQTPTKTTGATDTVRGAYERTFFDVAHQEEVYGDSLVESIAREFGWDFASVLRPGNSVQFSPALKQALLAATERSIDQRQSLLACVESEQESVERASTALRDLLEPIDSSVLPEWYRSTFEAELRAITDTRQQTLHDRTETFDNHDFCSYLYESAEWTYPVLTSVARLRESVSLS
ncbi:hypothetical protein ACFQJ5_11470 [Halomicroarcula sp. GCM10025324]|uniref:DUF7260 family protein n=1 Tax=Haloarcula TaxID=2237 RepID=UPI0023E8B1E4|nr:hypothetical protein [Halomicroarcula sp. ZS-22-S1]